MPRYEQVLEVPQDRICQSCGMSYEAISGTDDCEVLEYVVKLVVRWVRRTKYARSYQCAESPSIMTDAPADRVIP